ncbi:MAG: hypothetical protein II911_03925, partial [Clostridia bacterium]|nr:hypothetical protein [Clostridia bacterium]
GFMKQNGISLPGRLPVSKLSGDWIEIGSADDSDLCRLKVKNHRIYMTGWGGEKSEFGYTIPSGRNSAGMLDGEVKLELTDCREFENLIYHEEKIDGGKTIPILSATLFEYDGRGEVVFWEFVRIEDAKLVGPDFRSSSCIYRNDRDPIPTAMMPEPICLDRPDELKKEATFYARVPKNRYGGSCQEGDYAFGSFLLWLCEVELAEDGTVVKEAQIAVPYIVSSGGNGENLSLLSGGPDGMDPYGDDVWKFTTDEKGEIVDAVFVGNGQ